MRDVWGPTPLIYLCMERWDMWQKVLGYSPQSTDHLDFIFATYLHKKFPNSVGQKPNICHYQSMLDWINIF